MKPVALGAHSARPAAKSRLALVLPFLAAAAGIGLSAIPAAALDDSEAQAVVVILEELASETGDTVYYDEEAAEEWYQLDDETSQRIPAAGFTRESWKEAFDQTLTGFIATVPPSEMKQMSAEFERRIVAAVEMTEEQKNEVAETWRSQFAKLEALRISGAEYAPVVGPYASRLRKIALQR